MPIRPGFGRKKRSGPGGFSQRNILLLQPRPFLRALDRDQWALGLEPRGWSTRGTFHDLLVGGPQLPARVEPIPRKRSLSGTTEPSAQRFLEGAFQDADALVYDLK
jgi:hypothetical protein